MLQQKDKKNYESHTKVYTNSMQKVYSEQKIKPIKGPKKQNKTKTKQNITKKLLMSTSARLK